MKNLLIRIFAFTLAGSLAAQTAATNPAATSDLLPVPSATTAPAADSGAGSASPPPAAASTDSAAATADTAYTPAQLNQLLGPIALYPDALIAIILPASTEPADIVLAARFVADKGDPSLIDVQPWDDSVKALAHYPDVVTWMSDNLSWTKTLGDAFVRQPADVMKSVQQLRAQAKAAGTLVDTPQQKVVVDDSNIVIQPAQPNVIYVPQYDPAVVYVTPAYAYAGPIITFSAGYPVGPWLGFQCNWFAFGVWVGPWTPGVWYYPQAYWGRPVVVVAGGRRWGAWSPPHRVYVAANQDFARRGPAVVPQPRVFAGAPVVPHGLGPASREGSAPAFAAERANEAPRATEAPRVGTADEARGAATAPRSPAPGFAGSAMPMPRSAAPVVADRGGAEAVAPGRAPEAAGRAPGVSGAGMPAPRSPAPSFAAPGYASGVNRSYAPVSAGSAPGASRSYYSSPPSSHAPSFARTYAPAPQAAPEARAPSYAPVGIGSAERAAGPVGAGGAGGDGRRAGP